MADRTEEITVAANGLAFRVRIEGPAGAPWLVFSNSLVTNLAMWDRQAAALRDRYRILRYDQRGHGRTGVPAGPATMAELGADLAELLRQCEVTDAVLCGISMGFATVIAAADRAPERVRALVLADGSPYSDGSSAALWRERVALVRAQGMAALVAPTVERWFLPAFVAKGGAAVDAVREMIRTTPVQGYAACTHALSGYDVRAELDRLAVPLLLVSGAHDGALPAVLTALAERMPNAAYAEIPDAGHIPAVEQPDRFTAAIEQFLATLG